MQLTEVLLVFIFFNNSLHQLDFICSVCDILIFANLNVKKQKYKKETMSTCTCNLQRILKFIQAAVGISVIVLGVFNFINQNLLEFTSLVKNVYFIFFGLLLALSALITGASSLLKWFPFLKNWFGIGCFMVFVGCSCINGVWSSFTSIVGLVAVVAGFLMMIIQ